MRVLTWFAIVSLVALAVASPVSARVVRMETTVALADQSEPSIERALRRALDITVSRALAMGLSSIWLDEARVLSDAVILRMVATDEELDEEDDALSPGPAMAPRTL